MPKLEKRIGDFYYNWKIVYRAHYNSFNVSFSNIFHNDLIDYIVKAYGLKKNLWKYFTPRFCAKIYVLYEKSSFAISRDLIEDIK